MEIGAPKNAKNHEDSVGLNPAGVPELAMRRYGIGVRIGAGIAFDADMIAASDLANVPVAVLPTSMIT